MIFRVGLAVELMTQAAKPLVQTVGIFETRANVKAWVKKVFINHVTYRMASFFERGLFG
jgi:hypothetical protein